MTFGVADQAEGRLTMEMVISGNEYHSAQRLKRPERFYQLILDYLKANYPEFVGHQKRGGEKKPRENFDEEAFKRGKFKRKRILKTQEVARKLDTLFRQSQSMAEVLNRILQSEELQLYDYQGEIRGILYQGQKYRFHTLGLCKSKTGELLKVWESRRQISQRPSSRIEVTERKRDNKTKRKEVERPLRPYRR